MRLSIPSCCSCAARQAQTNPPIPRPQIKHGFVLGACRSKRYIITALEADTHGQQNQSLAAWHQEMAGVGGWEHAKAVHDNRVNCKRLCSVMLAWPLHIAPSPHFLSHVLAPDERLAVGVPVIYRDQYEHLASVRSCCRRLGPARRCCRSCCFPTATSPSKENLWGSACRTTAVGGLAAGRQQAPWVTACDLWQQNLKRDHFKARHHVAWQNNGCLSACQAGVWTLPHPSHAHLPCAPAMRTSCGGIFTSCRTMLPSAVAELVLLPWRQELAPGPAHQVKEAKHEVHGQARRQRSCFWSRPLPTLLPYCQCPFAKGV